MLRSGSWKCVALELPGSNDKNRFSSVICDHYLRRGRDDISNSSRPRQNSDSLLWQGLDYLSVRETVSPKALIP